MRTFYTIGNLNYSTVNLVAQAICTKFGTKAFDKLVLLNSPESEKKQASQISIYRKYITTDFSVVGVTIDSEGKIKLRDLIDIFSSNNEKIVDLSNGQKITSSILYMAASLCSVNDIYNLVLHKPPQELPQKPVEGIDFDYVKLGKFVGLESLAKISYFDLIYYKEETEQIFDEKCASNSLYNKSKQGILKGISDFFGHQMDGRSAISNITVGNEGLIETFHQFIIQNPFAIKFAGTCGFQLDMNCDPVGHLQRFYRDYTKYEKKPIFELSVLRTLPALVSTMREYRNLTAHSSKHTHEFTSDEVRISINMMLEAFKCAKKNDELWTMIKGA